MLNLKVELGDRSYPIFIDSGNLPQLGEILQLYGLSGKAVVITDSRVRELYGAILEKSLSEHQIIFEVIEIPPGEKQKTLATVEKIVGKMLETQCDRKTTIVAFGGGVIGDIAGFTASIFKRGIPYIQVPTTLLAQVDSSVGGKTGVNHPLGKNMIGTFYQPRLVWIDLEVLQTLPRREILCGLAEIIKYGMIRDANLFSKIESHLEEILKLDARLLAEIVKQCCEIKAEVVSQDERETGLRMILNFGHTVGHALETALGYRKINHGEAVLFGMLTECKIAVSLNLFSDSQFQRFARLFKKLNLKLPVKILDSTDIIRFMYSDKKALAGKIRMVLPVQIGEVQVKEDLTQEVILQALDFLQTI